MPEGRKVKDLFNPPDDQEITLIVDMESKRPGCVLLQAAYGCGAFNGFLQMAFDGRHWLLAPTAKMAKIKGTAKQWKELAAQLDKIPKHKSS